MKQTVDTRFDPDEDLSRFVEQRMQELDGEDRKLYIKAANAAYRHGELRTVGDVCRATDRKLLGIRNIGQVGLAYLRELVGQS